MSVDPASFTTLLQAAQAGDSGAEGRLYAQVYAELEQVTAGEDELAATVAEERAAFAALQPPR